MQVEQTIDAWCGITTEFSMLCHASWTNNWCLVWHNYRVFYVRMFWKSMFFFTEQYVCQIVIVCCKILMFWLFLLHNKGLC